MRRTISQAFELARQKGRAAFIPYVTGGYPSPETSLQLVAGLARAGADIIEIGVPFSDPQADGPVIQATSSQAIASGVTPAGVIELAQKAAELVGTPLVLMTYYNPMLAMGLSEFAARAAAAGVAGVIVPDLTPEEAAPWQEAAGAQGLETIFLATPTTDARRMETIARVARGFLYYVSMTGVTGSALAPGQELAQALAAARKASSIPVAVGFGVAGPEQAGPLAKQADGVIVGSALMKKMLEAATPEQGVANALALAGEIRQSLAL